MKSDLLRRRRAIQAMACCILTLRTSFAAAQDWPARPIKLIVPFPPGTGTDVIGRTLAHALSERLGQSIVVENKAGAAGTLGADTVAKSLPDGYTLLLGQTIPNAIAPFTMPQIPYRTDDFAPVAHVGNLSNLLVVPASLGVKSVPELVSLIKSKPGSHSYSTSGVGSTHHIAAEQFCNQFGLSMMGVPYKGSTQALPDMVSGAITLRFDTIPPVLSSIQSGRLVALAVSAEQRLAYLPDVPTFQEAGIGNVTTVNWYCLLGPKGLSPAVAVRLNALVATVLADEQFRQRMHAHGFSAAAPMTPDALGAFLALEQSRYAKIAKDLRLTTRD